MKAILYIATLHADITIHNGQNAYQKTRNFSSFVTPYPGDGEIAVPVFGV